MTKLMLGSIHKNSHPQHKIFLCPELLSALKGRRRITVHYGQQRVQAVVGTQPKSGRVSMAPSIWEALSLPYPHPVHLCLRENQLRIGPLVGILTTGMLKNPTSPVGSRTGLFRRFLKSQEDLPASYFVFGPNDISRSKGRVQGTFLRRKNGRYQWQKYSVPFPAVVFDRVPNRTSEKSQAAQQAKVVLEQAGVRIFNPGFFNKWTIHRSIQDRKEVQPFIPETLFDPAPLHISYLLEKHGAIYLKPANGSLGLGIAKLYRVPQEGYFMRYRSHNQNRLKRFPDLAAALNHIPRRSSITYIAQQGIRLLQLEERHIDFRVHTNKNRHGQWKMTAVAAKIAGKGSVTTHMRTGGQVLPHTEVLDQCLSSGERKKALRKLEGAALTLSAAIEESLPGYFGEFGFDIGIDQAGHPWMFEANSKPGRHVFVHPNMKKSERLTRQMILDYALYLSDFTTKDVSPT